MADTNRALYDYGVALAAWEVRLYLNTHPTDRKAIRLYERLCCGTNLDTNYALMTDACKGGGESALELIDTAACCTDGSTLLDSQYNDDDDDCNRCSISWSWVESPWPWENATCDGSACTR